MLRFLSIRHLAVIDKIDLEFAPGLTVLTGETGAGAAGNGAAAQSVATSRSSIGLSSNSGRA